MSVNTELQPSRLSHIDIKEARTHNLKNLSIRIPHNKLIVITGLSGSGKSSLAFDTLFAEGQRRYMESLTAYARQFLGKINKPPVSYIKGILPSIGMRQKTHTHNPRSRVSTSADIYAYLKLLYARIGITYSPVSGQPVQRDNPSDVASYVQEQAQGSKVLILAPLHVEEGRTLVETLKIELQKGFTRIMHQKDLYMIEDLLDAMPKNMPIKDCYLVVDRLLLKTTDTSLVARITDSAQKAFFEGKGTCIVEIMGKGRKCFSDSFEADNIKFELPTIHFFNFNSPQGACKVCTGLGRVMGIDPEKVIPNENLSVAQGAILPWQSITTSSWKRALVKNSSSFSFPIHTPYKNLTPEQKDLLWQGNALFRGINSFFAELAKKAYKIQYRILHARYRNFTSCKACQGTSLREDAGYVKIAGKSLIDLLRMPIVELSKFFDQLQLTEHQYRVSKVLLQEIKSRLHYLQQVGLGYLTLHRPTNTLSSGEYQRIRLARALGSTLVDVLYILDEPTIGLHPRDTDRLVGTLVALQKAGNTVVVVEHEEAMMRAADQIIDIGPQAGAQGGELIFQGTWQQLLQAKESHTANYLTGKVQIPLPSRPRKAEHFITLQGAREHNLKNVTVHIPLNALTLVTGVSGSGKSTLVQKVLYPALAHHLGLYTDFIGKLDGLKGSLDRLQGVQMVGQRALGKSTRSNPATYLKVYDDIRKLFAQQPLSLKRSYPAGAFSLNIPGGRCEACLGAGVMKVDMQFLADVLLTCEHCHGKRFKKEVLEVTFSGKNIAQVLDMTVSDSLLFFEHYPSIVHKLLPLQDVGLGYLQLGQASSTFSGGEAQRLKLTTYLVEKHSTGTHTLFIFDEPTTGLHFHDISKLIQALQKLVEQGHTVLVIEHNTEVIKCADWIVDLGPEAGQGGGQVVFQGTPGQMVKLKDNHTAYYLRQKMHAQTQSNANK